MFDPKKFTTSIAKPLPVVLLLDVSYSMTGEKIENLNKAVQDMLNTFSKEGKMETEILVSVITFGNEVELHVPYTKASQVECRPLEANGMTPMGKALEMAKAMIEDKEVTPSRAYRPTIVLVSDGMPNDSWEKPLEEFIGAGRSSKCDRMAMAIGSDADEIVLKRFIDGTEHELFYAKNANQLHEFFKFVTMSVTTRTHSQNPNVVPEPLSIQKDKSKAESSVTASADIKSSRPDSVKSSNDSEEYW